MADPSIEGVQGSSSAPRQEASMEPEAHEAPLPPTPWPSPAPQTWGQAPWGFIRSPPRILRQQVPPTPRPTKGRPSTPINSGSARRQSATRLWSPPCAGPEPGALRASLELAAVPTLSTELGLPQRSTAASAIARDLSSPITGLAPSPPNSWQHSPLARLASSAPTMAMAQQLPLGGRLQASSPISATRSRTPSHG